MSGEENNAGVGFEQFIDSLESDPHGASGQLPTEDGSEELTPDQLEAEGAEGATKDGEGQGEGTTGDVQDAKKVYSPEELDDLLKTDGEIDTSRLSPEGKLLMKSFQRGFDGKFKSLAEERRMMEIERQKTLTPREKLFNDYLQDPGRVMGEINQEIATLEETPANDPKYAANRKIISQLNALKDEFRENRQMITESQRSKDSLYARTMANIIEEIPDWKEKEPKMTQFAVKELGLSLDDIRVLSDPTIMGERTVRFIRAVNKAYDRFNAGNSAESKKGKPRPLGRAGESGGGEKPKKSLEEMPYEEYKKLRMKEMQSQGV